MTYNEEELKDISYYHSYIDRLISNREDEQSIEFYKNKLKNEYNFDYISIDDRVNLNNDLIDQIVGLSFDVITYKGLPIKLVTNYGNTDPYGKKGLKIDAYHNNNLVGEARFHFDIIKKITYVSVVKVKDEFQQKGIYTEITDLIFNIMYKYGFKPPKESDRILSANSREFWTKRLKRNKPIRNFRL